MTEVVDGVDYCTGWPDIIWGMDLRACCKAHDAAYAVAHSPLDLVAAHWALAQCVAQVSWAMAATMFGGLITVGWVYAALIFNRGRPGDGGNGGTRR